MGEGFALYLVAARAPAQRRALLDALGEDAGLCVGFVDAWTLGRRGAEVLGEREQALGCEPSQRAVLVVEGIDDYRRHQGEFFRLLNQRRNVMLRATTAALIFVGGPEMVQALRRQAPDLWSVRAADLELPAELAPAPPGTADLPLAPVYPSTGLREKLSRTRLPGSARKLFGREAALARLDGYWDDPAAKVVTLVAWGGVGKTALVKRWRQSLVERLLEREGELDAVFDWTFYSQGVRGEGGVSADGFLREALVFFGEQALADSPQSQLRKAERLAQVVGERRVLLILDGLEPLQRPDGSVREPGIVELLERLALRNRGLCVVTTRVWPVELEAYSEEAAPRWDLEQLGEDDGAALLEHLFEVQGGPAPVASTLDERRAISRAVQGHALTLQLLGRYIREVLREVRRWPEVELRRADDVVQGGHAFRVMDAYVAWLEGGGEAEARELAALKLLGLFDRGAAPGCMAVLREGPAIPGVTDALVGLDDAGWAEVISRLESRWLVAREVVVPVEIRGYDEAAALATGEVRIPKGEPKAWSVVGAPGELLDAHPLVRAYFGERLREEAPAGWREGHRRLYVWLRDSVPYWPEGNEGLQPLGQAVVHGCAAGLVQEAFVEVFYPRVRRGGRHYSVNQLGAFSADLATLAHFFDAPWSRPSRSLSSADQAVVIHEAGFDLRALGRLGEALEPTRQALPQAIEGEDWFNVAIFAGNLSDLELLLGRIQAAATTAARACEYAERTAAPYRELVALTILGHAYHQAGMLDRARAEFERAETMQGRWQSNYPWLYSIPGHQYVQLLLHEAERGAWREPRPARDALRSACEQGIERATQTLSWVHQSRFLVSIGLDHLSLGRAALYGARVGPSEPRPPLDLDTAREHLEASVAGLREAGRQEFLPPALMTRAWLHQLEGEPEQAEARLAEAERIASRGPMPLHLADIHLHRARLFRDREALAQARALIDRHHYERRRPELDDATEAAQAWPKAPPKASPPHRRPRPRPMPMDRPDLALLVALPEELTSLARGYAEAWEARPNPNFPGSDFFFTGPAGYRCVVSLMPRMGPTPAAQVAQRLLAHEPAAILNVGIAGSLKAQDLRIGDVIVPREVDAYDETGKIAGEAGGWQRRGSGFRPPANLLAEIVELEFRPDAREPLEAWREAGRAQLEGLAAGPDQARIEALVAAKLVRRAPAIRTAHLASGSFVVASQAFARFIREANADIHAVEMEAAGMMAAAEYRRAPIDSLVVRGISDHVDADKAEVDAIGEGALRQLAMDNAWRLVELLMRLERLPRVG